QLTAEQFIDNPFHDANDSNSSKRLYKTGDLVRLLPDDNLAFIGRVDDQVKIRGFRIELGEIEARLAQFDSIDSAVVLAKQLAGSVQLVGYVRSAVALDESEHTTFVKGLLDELKGQLPGYMVPSLIMVVAQWPLTLHGKLDRKALPAPDGSALLGRYVAPQSSAELVLADIWADLLNIEIESVSHSISTTANFFELGGHSLLAIRLVAAIRSRCEIEISLQDIFNHSTLQDMALVIAKSTSARAYPPITSIKRNGDKLPVSFAQQRLRFIDSLQGGSPEYNMPFAFEVTGQLDKTLLSKVFNAIVERHEVLRTVYVEDQGQTLQHIRSMADINFEIKVDDLTHLSR
ncbi:MAG: condensation domain-containing protein, partial [Psychrosphaera sp.]|nr:condensation domain-containing protein [Psychrosphaera sp.]